MTALRAAVEHRLAHAVDEREVASAHRFLAELDRLDDPFDEHADPVHVTGSAIVTSERGVVLHRHKRLGLWLQTGGHLERGETPAAAALRETTEETGLPVWHAGTGEEPAVIHLDVHDGARGHVHLDLRYLLHAPPDDPAPPAGESQDVRWFPWDDAISVADAGLAGALRALRPSP